MKHLGKEWGKYIRSKKVLKTLDTFVDAVIEFNKERNNPFEIVKVGVGGSALRTDKPHDLDVLVFFKVRESLKKLYGEFREFLIKMEQSDVKILYDFKYDMMWEPYENEYGLTLQKKVKNSLTVREYVEENQDVLIDFGFKPIWIEWLKYQRFSDFLIHEPPFGFTLSFNPKYFVISKIRDEVKKRIKKGMKMDIQAYFIEESIDKNLIIPNVVVWENGRVSEITKDAYENYIKGEWQKLRKQFIELKKMFKDKDYTTTLPLDTYRYTLEVYWDKDGTYKNISKEIKKYVDSLILDGDKMLSSKKRYTVKSRELRKILKKMRIVGFVVEKVYRSRTFRYGWRFLNENISESEMREEVERYVLNNAAGGHITKDDLRDVIKDVDFSKVLIDIENSREASEDAGMGRMREAGD